MTDNIVIIPFEYHYNFSINTVWALLSDFGGWHKWYPTLINMVIEGGDKNQIGGVRKFSSKASNFVYEEELLEKDTNTYTLKYLVLVKTFLSPYTQQHMNVLKLHITGYNQCKLVVEACLTPHTAIPEEIIEKYKDVGFAGQRAMYGSLDAFLKKHAA